MLCLLLAAACAPAWAVAAGAGSPAAPGAAAGAVDTLRTAGKDSLGAAAPDSLAGPAGAAARDSTAARAPGAGAADTLGAAAPADTARRVLRVRKGLFQTPRWVMLRSLAVPGWGQLTNGSWLKGLVIGGLDGYLRVRTLQAERELRRLDPQVRDADRAYRDATEAASAAYTAYLAAKGTPDEQAALEAYEAALSVQSGAGARFNALAQEYNPLQSAQVNRVWLLGGVIVYALVDAYVDAHFRDFKVEFEYDPALPGGKPPAKGAGARLSLRWSF